MFPCNINSHLRIQQLQVVLDQKLFFSASGESVFECGGGLCRQMSVFDISAHIRCQPCRLALHILLCMSCLLLREICLCQLPGGVVQYYSELESNFHVTQSALCIVHWQRCTCFTRSLRHSSLSFPPCLHNHLSVTLSRLPIETQFIIK